MKEHASVDTKQGFVLATEMTPAYHHDSPYLPLCVAKSCHNLKVTRTKEPIKKVFADKGFFGKPNREFLSMNHGYYTLSCAELVQLANSVALRFRNWSFTIRSKTVSCTLKGIKT
jgi:hypothetical protein